VYHFNQILVMRYVNTVTINNYNVLSIQLNTVQANSQKLNQVLRHTEYVSVLHLSYSSNAVQVLLLLLLIHIDTTQMLISSSPLTASTENALLHLSTYASVTVVINILTRRSMLQNDAFLSNKLQQSSFIGSEVSIQKVEVLQQLQLRGNFVGHMPFLFAA